MLVIGGSNGGEYFNDISILKIQLIKAKISLSWLSSKDFELIGEPPSPREGHSLIKNGLNLFLIGGCNYSLSQCYNDIFSLRFDINLSGKKSLFWNNQKIANPNQSIPPREKQLALGTDYGGFLIGGHGLLHESHIEKPYFLMLKAKCDTYCEESNGKFSNGVCECKEGFYGESCELSYCQNNCNDNGKCEISTKSCICYDNFEGPDCSVTNPPKISSISTPENTTNPILLQENFELHGNCPSNCRNRGVCENDKCICLPEYFGVSCEFRHCPYSCGSEQSRGSCNHKTGKCDCFENFGGENCEFACPYGCPDGFKCTGDYTCNCEGCELPKYSLNCNEQGTLVGEECHCLPGFCGKFCDAKCPDCSGHGKYKGSCCECDDGYFGANCEISCKNRCSGNGKCEEGICNCESGWEGDDCSIDMRCNNDCNQRGFCEHGVCKCYMGYGGPECEHTICPMNCTILSVRYELYTDAGYHTYKSREDIPLTLQGTPIFEVITSGGFCNAKTERCECYPGYSGTMCDIQIPCPRNCSSSSHGTCQENGLCKCKTGWRGDDCSMKPCINDCSGNGICTPKGECICNSGYTGPDCSDFCPNDCSGNGICENSVCQCNSGFTGHDCSQAKRCPGDCSYRGSCTLGKCVCDPGYYGEACEYEIACPKECNYHGKCKQGKCYCDNGWGGEDCGEPPQCKNNCNGHGVCKNEMCVCENGWKGNACEEKEAGNGDESCDCNGNGICKNGICYCLNGWKGEDCSQPTQACGDFLNGQCSGHGICKQGQCECNIGYSGNHCERASCQCQNGKCIAGICTCNPGFIGKDCSLSLNCPKHCSKNGKCLHGDCLCNKGWTGKNCEIKIQDECNSHGTFHHGRCLCEPGYSGSTCTSKEAVKCLENCSNHGMCQYGHCYCDPGYTGEICEISVSCPISCPAGSICIYGSCFCEDGQKCGENSCPNSCSGNGVCENSKCLCKEGYHGEDCSLLLKTESCPPHSKRNGNICECEYGWTGENCLVPVPINCPGNGICNGHGSCFFGKCYCDPQYDGEDCSIKKSCPDDCNSHGVCRFGKCYCNPGFRGKSCQKEVSKHTKCDENCDGVCFAGNCYCQSGDTSCTAFLQQDQITPIHCPLGCSGKGRCVNNKCLCDEGWMGEACEVHILLENAQNCINDGLECSGNGICNNGKCFCDQDFTGVFCETSNKCTNCNGKHQVCNKGGKCECENGWGGEKCEEESSCIDIDCGEHGICMNGECLCKDGYSSSSKGEKCSGQFLSILKVAVFSSLFYGLILICLISICKKQE
ncbi:unnamed protein product [Blepharisma stoltei]|uniref:EGF-like domain-containing protein n=1 Tax=Blepharisma stoltei TaxID=1481888 RepID=A0AAU9KCN6_9CILI|nr:unnamed protein product [Blepharisma stoltei]